MQLSGQSKCLQCAKQTVKNEGLLALYRSLPITLMMNAPYHVSTVIINENMKKIVKPKERDWKFASYFFCAAFAGAVSSFITCPMDNIKTKLQTQSTISSCEAVESKLAAQHIEETYNIKNKGKFDKISPEEINCKVNSNDNEKVNKTITDTKSTNHYKEEKVKYHNIRETFLKIYREDGIKKGFFRGVVPRMLCNSPSCAISWCSYEIMKHLLSDTFK